MNYEENMKKLEKILNNMESSDIGLDQMMKDYKEAIELYNTLNNYLSEYKQEIEKVTEEGLKSIITVDEGDLSEE